VAEHEISLPADLELGCLGGPAPPIYAIRSSFQQDDRRMTTDENSASASIRRHMIAGLASAGFVCFGIGGWATFTKISGAVIGSGQIVVESDVKKVQHPTGGVVGELLVRNGDHVEAGQVVLRLDETVTRANLAVLQTQIDELLARRARNEAERDGADRIRFPQELEARRGDPTIAQLINGEEKFFAFRQTASAGKKAQLRERIGQLETESNGLEAQVIAKVKELDWIAKELVGVHDLWKKQMVQFPRVTALERESARMEGERGRLVASQAQIRGKITETELEIIQVDQDIRSEVGKELAEIRGKLSELLERRVAAEDQLRRIDLRAPQNGIVHQLDIHTVGGVIGQGQAVMIIVPAVDELRVEAKIAPADIDQVHLGQKAHLRLSAFNRQTTPELDGTVILVGADAEQEEKANTKYYTVRLAIAEGETAKLNGLKLVPGMPVECFIETGFRTVLSYLMRPIENQIRRAFRES
jgi:HlyD family secretion protein